MQVLHRGNDKKAQYYIEEEGETIGFIDYVYSGDKLIIIEHTEVMPGNEGRGLGKKLVGAVVDMAREKGLEIMPLCPFANAIFKRTDEYNDVLFHRLK